MKNDLKRKLDERESSFQIFDTIHKRYDLLNHLLSLGLDFGWRKRMAKRVPKGNRKHLLDLATGTGDVAFSLLKHAPVSHAYGCDMAQNMLTRAEQKASKKKVTDLTTFLRGDAAETPFKDGFFDVVTMAFGIRNTPEPPKVLEEMKRVLKPGGKTLILEFSLPTNKLMKKLHLLYLRHFIPRIGTLISGDKDAYRYLNKTIETFPYGESFGGMMRDAGFKNVSFTPLTFGVVTLYDGEK